MAERHLDQEAIDLLLCRLTWPSPIVRERTAIAVADLLAGPDSSVVQASLLKWIREQTLESVVALGLLPICRAEDAGLGFQVPHTVLMAAVGRPSLLSHLLLRDLGVSAATLPAVDSLHSGRTPADFRPRPFFEQNARSFVAPVFSRRAETIERSTLLPFRRQWAFEWETLVKAGEITPTTAPLWFRGRQDGEHLPILDTKLSEIYHSAYLRALAWAVSAGQIHLDAALSLAAETCPIDLGLWTLKPGRRPAWWPSVQKSEGSVDITPGRIWAEVARLWEEQRSQGRESVLLAAGGHVHEVREAAYELEISGIFQATSGSVAGKAEEVFERCCPMLRASTEPLRYSGSLQMISPTDLAVRSGDWSVVPASGYVAAPANCRWQYWRMFRGLRLPAPFLAETSLTFRCSTDAVEVSDATGVRAWLHDWTDGVREKLLANLQPRSGYVLTADADMVHGFAARTGSTFSWVCRLTTYQRRYEYGSFETANFYATFGTRGIIIPR